MRYAKKNPFLAVCLGTASIIVIAFVLAICVHCEQKAKSTGEFASVSEQAIKLGNPTTAVYSEIRKTEFKMISVAPAESDEMNVQGPIAVAAAEPETKETVNYRYCGVTITQDDLDELAAIVWLEARGECTEGQQAVVEVILNRVVHSSFPHTIHDVIWEGAGTDRQQFSPVFEIPNATPGDAQYKAIHEALYGKLITDPDVVFFSTNGENDRVFAIIGNHVFCREYVW